MTLYEDYGRVTVVKASLYHFSTLFSQKYAIQTNPLLLSREIILT